MGKLNMTHFAVADISSVCRVIEEEAGKCTIPEAKSHETYTTFAANHTEYQGSLTRDKSSESSPRVVLADKRRDRAASGVFRVIDGLTYSPNPDIARKAETLSLRLDKFTGIQPLPNTQESTEIRMLTALLDEPDNAALAKDLGLEPYVAELKAAEAEFTQAWNQREADVAAFRNSLSASTLRRKMEKSINRYYDFVLYNAEFSGKPEWRSLQQQIFSRFLTIRQKYQDGNSADKQ